MIDSLQVELDAAKHQAALNTGAAMERDTEKQNVSYLKQTIEELTEELNQRKAISREDMLRPIQVPPLMLNDVQADKDPDDLAEEHKWLEHIRVQSKKSGIHFNERQLMAYHTSLKIGEWSPLVVLSGVSGTGKSELPKQYAIHGGMQFLSVPVKPDWDSPASLFGYYNSIENKFEATELIRALYQMQRNKKTPWSDSMLMVLLDEMNLAHPEQYFADLLSKFEESRKLMCDKYYKMVWDAVGQISAVEEKLRSDWQNLGNRYLQVAFWIILSTILHDYDTVIYDYKGALHDEKGCLWFGDNSGPSGTDMNVSLYQVAQPSMPMVLCHSEGRIELVDVLNNEALISCDLFDILYDLVD